MFIRVKMVVVVGSMAVIGLIFVLSSFVLSFCALEIILAVCQSLQRMSLSKCIIPSRNKTVSMGVR